jgi:[ribosomal protein S5]-alanine N-acetyltransferase
MLPERVFGWPIVLRHFLPGDAPRVQQLAGDRAVSDTTALIPHPYRDGMAEAWIATHEDERAAGRQFTFAVARAEDELLVGAIALRPVANEHENVGYWVGREFWGHGYATAATRSMVALAFSCLDCQQITASHLARNPASGRVMEKCGLVLVQRETRDHRGRLEEFCVRGITRDAWEKLA